VFVNKVPRKILLRPKENEIIRQFSGSLLLNEELRDFQRYAYAWVIYYKVNVDESRDTNNKQTLLQELA
jgi:hypothetical protein